MNVGGVHMLDVFALHFVNSLMKQLSYVYIVVIGIFISLISMKLHVSCQMWGVLGSCPKGSMFYWIAFVK